MIRTRLLILLFLLTSLSSQAQAKMEFEKRIDRSQFPATALQWLDTHPEIPEQVRYYIEQDGQQTSYEVKFKAENKVFSIEFDTTGKLLDVEVLIRYKTISPEIRSKIAAYLDSGYKRWRTDRVQKQYTLAENGNDVLERIFLSDPGLIKNLELEVSVREEGLTKHYELTFGPTGELIGKRAIEGMTYDYKKF
ncbi:hypothetical protein [Aureitalea marina]|uniref:PepSY domain-containing protein n=1 Tax=Aureitalea marina TaxID=930804 RepID=A0A2S7KT62_9FLAO|nr:hypothetical protein [Aureitalea marina]PQB05812.1 hypothetical protein BST85_13580 [Aureitalea marina]